MTYAYSTHGAPAVGGGLPGLPQRQSSGGITSGAIPVNAQFGYADEQPANAVEVGAIVEREDYPALSAQIPHTFEQTVQLPTTAPDQYSLCVVAFDGTGEYLARGNAGTGNATTAVYKRDENDVFSLFGQTSVSYTGVTSTVFDANGDLYVGNATLLHLIKKSAGYSSQITVTSGAWPVKLLAVSPDGTLLAAASSTTSSGVERVRLFRRSGDTFTVVALSVTTSATINGLEFSKDGKYLYVMHNASPFFRVFDVSSPTPTEVSPGLSWGGSGLNAISTFKVLSDESIFFVALAYSTLSRNAFRIKRQGASFSLSDDVEYSSNVGTGTSTATFGLNVIHEIDEGSVIVLPRALVSGNSVLLFNRTNSGFSESAFSRNMPLSSGSSISEDSKFLALGLNAHPWLAVYGSESKMVARLNERSPTGQKLYMKVG